MTKTVPHITVCICTFRRPRLLKKLLDELARQETGGLFSFSIVVADNDRAESGRQTVSEFQSGSTVQTIYCVEPEQNIALTRNRALAQAGGDFVAFIDDDEYPKEDWLLQLYNTCEQRNVAGVLGPVRPYFDQEPPAWARAGGFFDRPEHSTGFVMDWEECRTGSLLFRRSILKGSGAPFDRNFGTGGEDKDFFMRMIQAGCVFVWCNEAIVYELVPPSRWRKRYMLGRALLRGKNIIKHPVGRYRTVLTSCVAVPLYGVVLPFLLLFSRAQFMKYAIKFCDHAGRLLALVGLNLVSERKM